MYAAEDVDQELETLCKIALFALRYVKLRSHSFANNDSYSLERVTRTSARMLAR